MLFLLENLGKTFYCFLFLFSWCSKTFCVRKKPFYFSSIFESLLLILLSLHEKPQKTQPKNLHFLFLFRPCFVSLFLSFNIFPVSFITVFFVHFSLSSFCSSLIAFSLLFLFSHFSILSLFLHLSVFLSLFFCISCFLNFFSSSPRFCESSFCFTSFFFSLFCS